MSGQQQRRIVVGVDGSPSSKRALAWAVHQAELDGSVIDAVCAWQYPISYGWVVTDEDTRIGALAAETLDKVIAEVRRDSGRVSIRPHVVAQNPARALIDAAEGADLLVIGSRGHGGFTGALLGSVGQHCVHHAPCPVLVIRGTTAGNHG